MKFRLVWYDSKKEDRYDVDSDYKFEYLGNRESIWRLWFILTEKMKYKHVWVYNLEGTELKPEKGLNGLFDYNL